MSADGPYVIYEPDGKVRVISVTAQGQIEDTTYTVLPQDFTLHVTDHKGRYPFDVKLHPVKRPEWQYRQPDKVFVMSDPHGKLNCVMSLLRGNNVIDKDYHWSFGTNHLVVIVAKMCRRYFGCSINWRRRRRMQVVMSRFCWVTMNRL